MSDILLETRGLKKYFSTPYGQLHAVDDVNITIERGKTLGVVGESGCGKSTLGRTLLRLLPITEGEVLFNGVDLATLDRKQMTQMRRRMQIIFQDPYSSVDPRMSVFDLIAEPLRIHKVYPDRNALSARVDELMDTVGIAQRYRNTYPHELDGGRRQRIVIARAIALNPEFIVCDEPVSALDVSIQAQILNLLMDLQDRMGLTYIFITHDLSVVKHISNDIAVMYLGQVVEKAPVQQLFESPKHPYTITLLNAIPKPDPDAVIKDEDIVHGEVTSPIEPKDGCRFAARCPYADERCHSENQILTDIGAGHFVSCHKINGGTNV